MTIKNQRNRKRKRERKEDKITADSTFIIYAIGIIVVYWSILYTHDRDIEKLERRVEKLERICRKEVSCNDENN